MGTMISLGVGKLEIDWGKNNVFENFRDLFQPADYKDINYYYADNVVQVKKGYSRELETVKPRLNLLGYTLEEIKRTYDNLYNEYHEALGEYAEDVLTFEEYFSVFATIDLAKVCTLTEYDDWDFGEYASKCIFEDAEIQNLLNKYSANRQSGEFYENIPPRVLIRVLCENPTAKKLPLQWYMMDSVESGWAKEEDLAPHLEDKDKILIVTEGKTDTFILETAIIKMFPHISDFFYFIDMEENYPFTGTGNLYNFSSGLTKIKIQNKTLVIFDNDEAGIFSYNKCKTKLEELKNLKFYHLPNMIEFDSFLTVGPTGESYQNINGKAVSIECFLDLKFGTTRKPMIRWTLFNEKSKTYQGSLIAKDDYTRIFKKSIDNIKYNATKLKFLIEDIVNFWCAN